MMSNFKVVATGSQSFLTVEGFKNVLRITWDNDDARVAKCIREAISAVEDDLGFYIQPTTCSATYDWTPNVLLADFKVDEIVSITSGSTTLSGSLTVKDSGYSYVSFPNQQCSGKIDVVFTTGKEPKNGNCVHAADLLAGIKYEFPVIDKQSLSVYEQAMTAYDRLINKAQTKYL